MADVQAHTREFARSLPNVTFEQHDLTACLSASGRGGQARVAGELARVTVPGGQLCVIGVDGKMGPPHRGSGCGPDLDSGAWPGGHAGWSPTPWYLGCCGAGGYPLDGGGDAFRAGGLAMSANPLNLLLDGAPVDDIAALSYQLWSRGVGDDALLASFAGDNTTATLQLAAGIYYLRVAGRADGKMGGAYGVSLAAAPVPEPASYVMLVGGLLLLASLSCRRAAASKF